jgi:hypothetical protein
LTDKDVRARVDLSAGTSSPATIRLQFLPEIGAEENVARPRAGSSALVSIENPGAVALTVHVSTAQKRVALEAGCCGELTSVAGGALSGVVPAGGTIAVRASAVAVGEPQQEGDVITIQAGSVSVPLSVWIEPLLGQWRGAGPNGSELELPLVSVHTALMQYGEEGGVLFYSPPRRMDKKTNKLKERPKNDKRGGGFYWDLHTLDKVEMAFLDLKTYGITPLEMSHPQNLFCSGHAHLGDGRLLVVGGHTRGSIGFIPIGHNANALHVFDPAGGSEGSWTRLPAQLPETRWYPTITALPDGRMLIVSGRGAPLLGDWQDTVLGWYRTARRTYEIFDPSDNTFAGGAASTRVFVDEDLATYPAVMVLPGGANYPHGVVFAQERRYSWLFQYDSSVPRLNRAARKYEMKGLGSRSYPYYGSAALLPFDADANRFRILVVGGQHEDNANDRDYRRDQVPTRTAELFEFDNGVDLVSQSPWRRVMPLGESRLLPSTVHLADGTVLVTGGARLGWANCNSGSVLAAELFDPADESFRRMASARVERRYHSTALLLPDGTLLSTGSTGGFNLNNECIQPQFVAERFYPPYLWRGPRPSITAISPSSGVVSVGGSFDVTVSSTAPNGMRVALVRLASVTHGNNMDQRFVWLKSVPNGNVLTVDAPSRGDVAPPGDYLLFVVDGLGVPSKAKFLRLNL